MGVFQISRDMGILIVKLYNSIIISKINETKISKLITYVKVDTYLYIKELKYR